jgi:hypothetical protein
MNWKMLALLVLVTLAIAAVVAGFSDGGDGVLATWWEGP